MLQWGYSGEKCIGMGTYPATSDKVRENPYGGGNIPIMADPRGGLADHVDSPRNRRGLAFPASGPSPLG